MKKNRTMRVAALLLALTLITSCFVGGTMAKYVSSATGSDSATVASWEFEVGASHDIAPAATTTFTFDLFETMYEEDVETDEIHLSNTNGTIIAPGTGGEFAIVLKNKSAVPAQYAIDYTVTNANNIPVKFSIDGTNWTDDLADVTASASTQLAHTNGTETITVMWKWEFYVNDAADAADTALGEAGTASITVAAKVTATQVD